LKKVNNSGSKNDSSDTIAAIATPTGSGGIGIIRISGPRAVSILKKIFVPQQAKSKLIPYMLRFGRIVSHNDRQGLDEILAAYMPKSKSFTGEDMVELYCHAGQFTLKAILDNILELNCRIAEPGEFSMRRFLNHGVDLSKLEGTAETVASKTDLAYRLSREHLLGAYGDYITSLRKQIVHLLAELEADIDFPEEDSVGGMGRSLLREKLGQIIDNLEQLSASYKHGRIIQDGYRVVLLGPPNSGKSSLFNRLIKQSRALVTPVPGTTRDYISEWIDIEGLPVELFDTAGLREGRGRVERAGIEATRRLIKQADLILYLYDLAGKIYDPPGLKTSREQQLLIILNKVDLLANKKTRLGKWGAKLDDKHEHCVISAKNGIGVRFLIKMIYKKAGVADLTSSLVVTSHRHKVKINACLKHLRKIRKISGMPPEIISFELRQAANSIGEITGSIYTEEILDEIFANFCVGK
jgi:tRNA modification GTPase